MSESETVQTIRDRMAELHGHWYGRGPSTTNVYVADDVVVVVMEETFTPAEHALIERKEAGGIQEIRRRFQQTMADEFISIVTQATGRQVRSFVSDTDLDQGIAIETFVLGGVLADMSRFEASELDEPDRL